MEQITDDKEMLSRWRLILGQFAEDEIAVNDNYKEQDACLSFLYDREYSGSRGVREDNPFGGRGDSVFSIPDWLGKVKKLFPKKTAEILQKDALNKYEISEMLTDPEILKNLEPDINLLSKLIAFHGIIPPKAKEQADLIIRKTAEEISRKLEDKVRKSFYGKKLLSTQTTYKIFRNFDFKKTVAMNLKNYSKEYNTIIAKRLYFNNTVKRYNPWEIIILVDESGSMLNSVIYTAIMAGIFSSMPFLKIKLVVFDTNIVDLSEYADNASDILMKVQLGGGTNIYKALCYGESIITAPQKTIVVLISDLYEGGDIRNVYRKCSDILEGGSKLFVLPALDYAAEPCYYKEAGKTLAKLGADVAAITPEEMAEWIGNVIS